jgi:pyruvate dehydrogenase E2 component (dihydrolipoamide acetyltransferase)
MGKFLMPSLGADMQAATLVEWYMQPGDRVNRGDIIADIQTDKGDIDVEVFEDGILEKILIQPGEKLPVGTVMAYIRGEGEPSWDEIESQTPDPVMSEKPQYTTNGKAKPTTSVAAQQVEAHDRPARSTTPYPKDQSKRIKASPLARKIAAEQGIDLHQVHGSRPNGAIGRVDVEQAMAEQAASAKPSKPATTPSSDTAKDTFASSMRRAIAAAMSRSNQEIPHYYLETQVDMHEPLKWLTHENRQRAVKDRLLPSVLFVRALALALAEVPQLNGYWKNGQLEVQEAIHIGMAIALRQGGLVIPAIHNADMLSLDDIMKSILDLTQRVRSGRLRSFELSDATITLTSLGDRGVETVYGVVYPPQVAIIGLGKVTDQVRVSQGMLGIRPVLHATLAADHRATDGHQGALFLDAFSHYLQDTQSFKN